MNFLADQNSISFIILTKWAPPLLTVFVGGLLASLLFPRWQDRHANNQARQHRRLALAEEVQRNFRRYISSWNRLRSISQLERDRPNGLSNIEFERKNKIAEARTLSRDELLDTMCSLEIYFSDEVQRRIWEFYSWDDRLATLRLEDLPSRSVFLDKQREIILLVQQEILK